MENKEIILRPSNLFAFGHAIPMLLLTLIFLLLAWWLSSLFYPFQRLPLWVWHGTGFLLIRSRRYLVEPELIRIISGIVFKRTEQVELYRVKDYTMTQPFLHQLFGIMDLNLKRPTLPTPLFLFRGYLNLISWIRIRERVQEARQHNKIVEIN